MRILLIAYDFPPIPSPQSLRWAYLTRELALAGHEVHVLAPDVEGYGAGGLPVLPAGVAVHRVWPGPLAGYITSRQRKARRRARNPSEPGAAPHALNSWGADADEVLNWKGRLRRRLEIMITGQPGGGLNWKGRLIGRVKATMSLFLFPDCRAEWMPWARRMLDHLLLEVQPDVVVSSHEPATTIELGLRARRKGFAWVADLGDPVLAPYTPRRWRKRALSVEATLCREADLVTVTSAKARDTLHARHGVHGARCLVLTQGYDHRAVAAAGHDGLFEDGRLEMLYTGSFYTFRKIGELLQVLPSVPMARLNVATVAAPPELVKAQQKWPDQIRLLGFVPHDRVLAMQRRCDVLINIANADPVQVPGKFYEYLGSGTPILHIGNDQGDAAAELLNSVGGGWCEPDDPTALSGRLRALAQEKLQTGDVARLLKGGEPTQYSWCWLASRLVDVIQTMRPSSYQCASRVGIPASAGQELRTRQ